MKAALRPVAAVYGLIIGFFYGTLIAEVALRVTGRKRGIKMEILAGACALIGVLVGRVLGYVPMMPAMDALPVFYFFNSHTVLLIGVSVFGAVNRIRYI